MSGMKKLKAPAHERASGMHERAVASKRAEIIIRHASGKELEPLPLTVCNPHGDGADSIHNRLSLAESEVATFATGNRTYLIGTGILDKCNQNAINHLGEVHGAGDAAMKAHWDVAGRAATVLAHANGSERAELIRVNMGSDEGVLYLTGRQLGRDLDMQFGKAWAHARRGISLKTYTYSLEVPCHGGTREYALDLEAFSRVLRHPDMALSCHHSFSRPRRIGPDADGFIAEEIRKLENREVQFYNRLPAAFRTGNGGLAEVIGAFKDSLAKLGISSMGRGSFVEVKLGAKEKDALALLPFVEDSEGRKGTRKGFAEIYSGAFGMRGLNTFLGKARANSNLTPIVWAMKDVSASAGVYPLNGSYLQYWVDLPPSEATRSTIATAVGRRIHSTSADKRYIDVDFTPVVTVVDAAGVNVSEARARFILASMGKGSYPPGILDKTDFVLNFVEHIHRRVQDDIYARLAHRENGGSPIRKSDLEHINDIRYVCSARRTVRNTEDLVWILRKDGGLPEKIKAKRSEIESWLFEFSASRFEAVFRLLADKIRDEIRIRA